MATRTCFLVVFLIMQGQQEFRKSAKLNTAKQCSSIYRTLSGQRQETFSVTGMQG